MPEWQPPPPAAVAAPVPDGERHRFTLGRQQFLLDGRPFQIRSGEMHPVRIPAAYWRHRIRMARSMGLNTVALYLMWNALEPAPGSWDFGGRNDVARFIRLCAQEGMWVYLRPGPYVCAEWDFGGLPPWLLQRTRRPLLPRQAGLAASRRHLPGHAGPGQGLRLGQRATARPLLAHRAAAAAVLPGLLAARGRQ